MSCFHMVVKVASILTEIVFWAEKFGICLGWSHKVAAFCGT